MQLYRIEWTFRLNLTFQDLKERRAMPLDDNYRTYKKGSSFFFFSPTMRNNNYAAEITNLKSSIRIREKTNEKKK